MRTALLGGGMSRAFELRNLEKFFQPTPKKRAALTNFLMKYAHTGGEGVSTCRSR